MTITTTQKRSSEMILAGIREEASSVVSSKPGAPSTLSKSILEAWSSLPSDVRAALVSSETSTTSSSVTARESMSSMSTKSSVTSDEDEGQFEFDEECDNGAVLKMRPLERAPKNVFEFTKTHELETTDVKKTASAMVTTKTTIVTTSRGWRNIFALPISYDVNIVPHGTLLDPSNPQLLDSTGVHPEGYNRRFAVIDSAVYGIYGVKIRYYFTSRNVELHFVVLEGGERAKRPDAVDTILDKMCEYKLRRREPFLAIGGGCILDVAGMAACLYRRGVPFVRVPTTLLAIVDASVGVKNGVDYCCGLTNETYKNRVGSFYPPSACLLDNAFIATQDRRNVSNGFGEILKLALVRSADLFELLETHGAALIESQFMAVSSVPEGVSDRIIELSIQIMLEELGPNLWEYELERCVDYGHTFSKLLEMVPGADILHGEAVNVDGFFCCVISHLRGYIPVNVVDRIFHCMQSLSLPTNSGHLQSGLAWQSCFDAIEHRNGEMRIPLITDIGESICVSDITPDELDRALLLMKTFPHKMQ